MTRTLSLLASACLLSGCSKAPVEAVETKSVVTVTTEAVTPQTVEGFISATGTVAAAPGADWTITAPEHARIVEIPKAEGDRVSTGDLLVRFEIPQLNADVTTRRADVQAAQAHVENAQANVTRLTTLVDHGVAAQKELEDARRDLNEARAAVAQAQGALQAAQVGAARTIVRARFPGVVAKRAHNPGDMVEATSSDVILRVIDPAKLQVVAGVAIADLARVQPGRPVRIVVPGVDEPETGKVLTRPAAVEQTGVSADVRISFDAQTRLAAGTPVRVEIVAERHANALAVPAIAVLHEDEDTFVMVAGADNKAHKRKVTLGITTAKLAEVTSGLKAGEAVIVQGQQGLPDNADIAQAK
jgi:RND family efflux transporter MFP subunit